MNNYGFKAGVATALEQILSTLNSMNERMNTMSQQLDDLKAQVEATEQVEQSAIALIEGLAAQLAAIKDDPAAIEALSVELKAQSDQLAAAVANFTPAA